MAHAATIESAIDVGNQFITDDGGASQASDAELVMAIVKGRVAVFEK